MKIGIGLLAAAVVAIVGGSIFGLAQRADEPKEAGGGQKKKVLFFTPSFGFRHEVVTRKLSGELSFGETMLKDFAGKAGYDVDVSQDFNDLGDAGAYKRYAAVIFYTTGNPPIDRDGLLKYVRDGGALIGIHTATDTFHSPGRCGDPWPEYVKLIGASFKDHGPQHDPVVVKVEDADSPITKMLKDGWAIGDEIYLFNNFSRDNVHVLLSVNTEKTDEKSLEGHHMKRGQDYAISWTRTEGKGRVFYTSLGHDKEVWQNPLWQKHLLAGMAWAIEKK